MDVVMKLHDALPAPFVREARDGVLTVQDASQVATVVIPVDANLRTADWVTVHWVAAGAGTSIVSRTVPGSSEGSEFAVVVPPETVASNVGHQVLVIYLVNRAKGGHSSPSGPLSLQVVKEKRSGDEETPRI
jgi:hypothetical protein